MKTNFTMSLGVLGFAALAGCATQPAAVPPSLADALARQGVGPVDNINYVDEHGQPMSAPEFVAQVSRSRQFLVTRARDDRARDVTLRLRPANYHAFNGLKIGEAWPRFRLTRLDGTPVDNKALEGRYTLVNFYTAASAASAADVPRLNALAERRKDLNLLAVTADSDADARTFADTNRFAWPVATGGDQLAKQIGIDAYPSLALFDPQGRLVAAMGRVDDADTLASWLGQKTGTVRVASPDPANRPALIDFRTCDRPAYPSDEVRAKHTGTVKLNFLVGVDGAIRKAEIRSSSGYPALDQAALAALSRYRFTPGTSAGVPAEKWSPVQYVWSFE
ncbi:TonB family C-terminal domain-containing protein [Massilia sp. PDC64]|nr:TonB family protein [Massilia sp. PDC64]SDD74155.1 TonB family C-terminal domain-containing protein [Massilia sp. PDC64]